MNDHPPPIDPPEDPDHSLISAVLDGEATAPETAHVNGDPRLAADLATLRQLQDEVRALADIEAAPLLVDTDARISAALAAHGDRSSDATAAATIDPVSEPTSLDSARRSPRRGRTLPVLAGVAATLVVVVVGAAFLRGTDRSDSTAATAAEAPGGSVQSDGARDEKTDDPGSAAFGTESPAERATSGADASQPPAPTTTAPATASGAPLPDRLVHLGSFDSIDDLRAAALVVPLGPAEQADFSCALPGSTVGRVDVGVAQLGQSTVIVVGGSATTPPLTVTVLDPTTCEPIG